MKRVIRVGLYVVIVACVVAVLVAAVADGDEAVMLAGLVIAGLAAYSVAFDRRADRAQRRADRYRALWLEAEGRSLDLFAQGVAFGRKHEQDNPGPRPETDQQTGQTP